MIYFNLNKEESRRHLENRNPNAFYYTKNQKGKGERDYETETKRC